MMQHYCSCYPLPLSEFIGAKMKTTNQLLPQRLLKQKKDESDKFFMTQMLEFLFVSKLSSKIKFSPGHKKINNNK